jgi:PAS domain S-box-containing protein
VEDPPLLKLLDHRFDSLAVETHVNLGPRAAVAVGAGCVSLMLLPWRVCLVWTVIGLSVEAWSWSASRRQFLGRPITRTLQVNYLATLVALIGNWFILALMLWRTGGLEGSLCALVIWLSVMGFAQTFASRSPIGFTVCGVFPTFGMLAVVQLAPNDGGVGRWSILGFMMLAIAFAIAGARQTFAAGRKFDESQEQLHDSEFQYRVLADNISDIVGRTALSGEWRYISPSIEVALGYTADEFRKFEHFSYVHPEDRPKVEARLEKLLADGGDCTFEYRLFRKDGALSWLETSFTLINDPRTGEPVELVSMSRDINHRKALEQDLVEALKHAEAAVVAKSDFLANITHELRTPLNAIVGFSGLLRTSAALSEKDSRQAKLINEASSTLLVVVNSVLDFSKLESGAFALDPQPFDPAQVVNSVASLVEDQARQRGLAMTVVIAGELHRLEGDAPRLQQVVLNLLSNALKFTREGGVEVRVEDKPGAEAGRRLCVSVSDTGVGVADDQLAAIFERFNQADPSVSRTFGGTGLGLAISKQIVELMGGEIGVRSIEGQGSTFWFEVDLPLADSADQTAQGDPEPAELDRPIRLLLVEDVEVNRELVQAILEPFDIEIETAVNGAEAVEAVGRATYDIVLMDVQMPIMDGMTATRRIRALPDPAASSLPIIAMTANVLPEQVQRCLEAGMDAHMGKPINPGRLLELLSTWSDADQAAELRRAAA